MTTTTPNLSENTDEQLEALLRSPAAHMNRLNQIKRQEGSLDDTLSAYHKSVQEAYRIRDKNWLENKHMALRRGYGSGVTTGLADALMLIADHEGPQRLLEDIRAFSFTDQIPEQRSYQDYKLLGGEAPIRAELQRRAEDKELRAQKAEDDKRRRHLDAARGPDED